MGPGRDHLREPRGAAEHVAEQFAQSGVRAQDRQELDARGHARQRFVEGGERGVGVARAGEGFEQRRRQLGQHFPRAGAADRRAPAEMPAANGLRRGLRALKSERAQGRKRLRIVDDAGEDKIAGSDAERRRVLEQSGVMMLDPGQVMGEVPQRNRRAAHSRRTWRSGPAPAARTEAAASARRRPSAAGVRRGAGRHKTRLRSSTASALTHLSA